MCASLPNFSCVSCPLFCLSVPLARSQAYRKYDLLTAKHIEALRKHTKTIQDARLAHDNDGIKASLKLYDEALEKCVIIAAQLSWKQRCSRLRPAATCGGSAAAWLHLSLPVCLCLSSDGSSTAPPPLPLPVPLPVPRLPLCRYIPVLMGMARIYWDRGNYAQVERIFRQSAEFASEHHTWKLNVAHTFFMQEGKYREVSG